MCRVESEGTAVNNLVVGSSIGLGSSLDPAREDIVEKLRGDDGSNLGDVGNGGVS